MVWFFVLIIVFAIGAGILAGMARDSENKKRGSYLEQKLDSIVDFEVTQKWLGKENQFLFAIDDTNEKVLYISESSQWEIPFKQIMSVEVLEDNTLISSKSSIRTIGGTIVGGAVAGGAGAVIGGLSGDSKQKKKVSKVQVKIKIRDINRPSLTIDTYNCETMEVNYKPINIDSSIGKIIYEEVMNTTNEIVDSLCVIIDQNDHAEQSSQGANSYEPQQIQNNGSIADELYKLAELKDKGILTDEEFYQQKQKLLCGNNYR